MSKTKKISQAAEKRLELVKGTITGPSFAVDASSIDAKNYIVKSRSPLIKPQTMDTSKAYVGVLKRFIGVEVGGGKDKRTGTMAEFMPRAGHIGFVIPLVAVLRGALEATGEGAETQSPFVGHEVVIQRLEARLPSKKGQEAWNFIVAISPEKV